MPVHTLEEVQAAAHKLLDHGLKHLIVTMGERGTQTSYASADDFDD